MFFKGSSLVFKVLFELIPHKAVKVCMQTSKRLRANLRGGIGSLHANFCPQACEFACKLARGGCKFECKLSGVGLQARVQIGDQA